MKLLKWGCAYNTIHKNNVRGLKGRVGWEKGNLRPYPALQGRGNPKENNMPEKISFAFSLKTEEYKNVCRQYSLFW